MGEPLGEHSTEDRASPHETPAVWVRWLGDRPFALN